MGGFGSGSHKQNKDAVEDGEIFDLSAFAKIPEFKERVIKKSKSLSGKYNWTDKVTGEELGSIYFTFKCIRENIFLNLQYNHTNYFTGEKTSMNYDIRLTSLNRSNRGIVYLLECPLCKSHRGFKLYNSGSKYFACRDCLKLNYRSSKDSRKFDRICNWFGSELGESPKVIQQSLKKIYS